MAKDDIRGALSILLLVVIAGIGGSLLILPSPEGNKDIFLIILTFLIAKGGTVIDFYFGSSQSSSEQKSIMLTQANALNLAAQAGVPPKVP
jgi:hypothetical protein